MPNQRKPGQTFIGVQISNELLASVEKARRLTHQDRSTFVRLAIKEKLEAMGFTVPDGSVMPPDRARTVIILDGLDSLGPHTGDPTAEHSSRGTKPPRKHKSPKR